MIMTQLSIIIPVYQVENYIRACLESIYRQGMKEDSFEVIVVNDGTKDRSMEVIQDITKEHSNITVINQKNQGLSMARNNGIEKAKGEYILLVDSDDLLAEKCLPPLIAEACRKKPDLVVADFQKMNDKDIEDTLQNNTLSVSLNTEEKSGWSLLLEDLNPRQCYVWRTIYRREFLVNNNIRFVPGIYYEDIPFTHECFLKAGRCLRVHNLLYIYRIGHASITTAINIKSGKDLATTIAKTWALRNIDGLSTEIIQRICDNVFASFSVLLYAIVHDVKKAADRKEILMHLKKVAPDLRFSNGLKQKFVYFLYRFIPITFIETRVLLTRIAQKKQ